MNWGALSILVLIVGLIWNQWMIALVGVIMLVLSITRVSYQKEPAETSVKHKLIQASPDVWDTTQEDMATFLAAEHGMPTQMGVDILEPITPKIAKNLGELQTGVLRNFMPFRAYGESSAIQRLLAGMVLPIDKWLYPKTFEAKFKGKFGKEYKGKTFVNGQEKDAEKLLKEDKK